jgi:PAS domain S-box-containing protein
VLLKEFIERGRKLINTGKTKEELLAELADLQPRLDKAEAKYGAIMKTAVDGFWVIDTREGQFLDVNNAYCRMIGYTKEELLQMRISDVSTSDSSEVTAHHIKTILKKGADRFETKHRRKDGSIIDVEASVLSSDILGNIFTVFVKDITQRKLMAKRLKLSRKILSFLNQPLEGKELVPSILQAIKDHTGIEAVGIRLHDEEDFPYYSVLGFPSRFVELENYLCSRDPIGETLRDAQGRPYLECMCGNVIMGLTDPLLPFFTAYGSFWTNSTSKLLAQITEKERRMITRNRCNSDGYESLALIPLHSDKETIGLLQLNDRRCNCFTLEMIQFFEGIGSSIGIAFERRQSFKRLRNSLGATVTTIAKIVETRDPFTAGHQRRVADLARTIATEMNFPSDQIDGLRMASVLHDIGKTSIPAEILSKPAKLTDIEFSLIKIHSRSGHDILDNISFPRPIARMVLEHHERIDGSGYPNGLTKEKLLIESRIISVADVVEAMVSHRPYRPAIGIGAALAEITKQRGVLYDPEVVDACCKLFNEQGYKLDG